MAPINQPHRPQTFREQALRLFPWICAHCGREFDSKQLRQLTVHHKDHNHNNNPPNGSNWELLCLYCHDNEHQRHQAVDAPGEGVPGQDQTPPFPFTPFARLATLLKRRT